MDDTKIVVISDEEFEARTVRKALEIAARDNLKLTVENEKLRTELQRLALIEKHMKEIGLKGFAIYKLLMGDK